MFTRGLKNNEEVAVGIAVVFFILLATVFYIAAQNDVVRYVIISQEQETVFPFARLLDGTGVGEEHDAMRRPVAVMIDNASDARPAVGIEHATLVYETIAEGAITRLLAIFDPADLPETIGPVRSLRPYFLAWANEVDAIVTHVGGSPQALNEVASRDNINEFFAGQFFYQESGRIAPHKTFTSRDGIVGAIELFGYATTTNFISWEYGPLPRASSTDASHITIDFSFDNYEAQWTYAVDKNAYTRKIGSAAEPTVAAKNIIVMVVPARVVDSELRRDVSYIGEGSVWVIREGKAIFGTWAKKNTSARTRFFDTDGNAIPLVPGTTWVEVIDDASRIRISDR